MPKSNYCCRKATTDDSVEKIAKYIHLTDPYIYPRMSRDPSDKAWINFISECLKEESNVFYIENISVVLYDSEIVGVACVIPCRKELTITKGVDISAEFARQIKPVIEGYFDPLIEESYLFSGHNIVNICVDEEHRGKGLGSLLMSHCIAEYGFDTVHLDVIASNKHAVRLYEKFGFETEKEYMGYSGDDTLLPCYHMIRKAE